MEYSKVDNRRARFSRGLAGESAEAGRSERLFAERISLRTWGTHLKAYVGFVLTLLLVSCGGGSDSGTTAPAQSPPTPQVGTIILQQVLLRAVPNVVTHLRFSGFDAHGTRLYGPVTNPKAQTITLTNVPIAVTQLQIEYLLGNLVVGMTTVPIVVIPGQPTIVSDPPFQDVQVVLSRIDVNPNSSSIADGTSIQFTATGTYTDATQRDVSASVTWSSGNTSVASISPGGTATGINPGSTSIQATLGNVSGRTNLAVTPAVITSIAVSPSNPSIADGTTQQFTAIANLSDGSTQDVTATATWTSSLIGKASVSTTGLATGVEPGQSTITAALNGIQDSVNLRVTPAVVTSIQLTPPNPSLADNTTLQLTATAHFSDGSTQDVTTTAIWNSSLPSIANVSPTGLVTGVDPGQSTITATFNGESGQTTLTVTSATIVSISVSPSEFSSVVGEDVQLRAVATLSDARTQDVTAQAVWTSSNLSVATVSNVGVAVGSHAGTAELTAMLANKEGRASLDVSPFMELLSVSTAGTQGNRNNSGSRYPDISSNGRLVVFSSGDNGLVANPSILPGANIFIRDTVGDTTTQVDRALGGGPADGFSVLPKISRDGRFVAFESMASNLIALDTNGARDIFRRDRATNVTIRVSISTSGVESDGFSLQANQFSSMSGDGRYIAFRTFATTLLDGDDSSRDVLVRDTLQNLTQRVSANLSGGKPVSNIGSSYPAFSADGRLVAFESFETDLVASDTNNFSDVFVRNLATGVNTRVSVDSLGNQSNGSSMEPVVSSDGRYTAFSSSATNLVPGDTNGKQDVFLHDKQTGTTSLVSVKTTGEQANDTCHVTSISGDGRFVVFHSLATNLVDSDTNGANDLFLHDTQDGKTYLISKLSDGTQGNGGSGEGVVSEDGRWVTFSSQATNFYSGDTNGVHDIFRIRNLLQP